MEAYQVLDLEMSRLREIQRWQASVVSKVPMILSYSYIFYRQYKTLVFNNGMVLTHCSTY